VKIRASLLTIIVLVLFAANAYALPRTSLQVTTSFDGWTDPYTDGPNEVNLGFGGFGSWDATGHSVIGSTYGQTSETASISAYGPTVYFPEDGGASEFWFTYTQSAEPIYVTVNLSASIDDLNSGSSTFDPQSYFHAYGAEGAGGAEGVNYLGYDGSMLTFALTGVGRTLGTQVFDPDFGFYMNTGLEDLFTINSLIFSLYNPFMDLQEFALDEEGQLVVELTNFDYNPTRTPIPGAAWLLGSGLVGLVGLRRRFKA
jgi:hypothetical protein